MACTFCAVNLVISRGPLRKIMDCAYRFNLGTNAFTGYASPEHRYNSNWIVRGVQNVCTTGQLMWPRNYFGTKVAATART